EVLHFDDPHGLGHAEFFQFEYALDADHGARQRLGGAAHGVQVDRTVLDQALAGLVEHAAYADHAAHTIACDDVRLVRLFARACRRPRSDEIVGAVGVLPHDWTAMINDRASQVRRDLLAESADQPVMGRV